jgi:isoleucyl-tRNA synthetase
VNPTFTYVRVRNPASGAIYIVAEARLAAIPGAVPKPKKGGGAKGKDGKKGKEGAGEGDGAAAAAGAAAADGGFEVLQKMLGTELVRSGMYGRAVWGAG